tara:strand:+ start:17012 stop:17629 length:618 start_codon:yes stop_codon:yes gene_type:complete
MESIDPHNFEWNDIYTGQASDLLEPDAEILAIVDSLRPGRALDVGCGAGGLVLALLERGWEVTGVDIAENAIAAARNVLAARDRKADLHVADASSFRPSGRYDLVTCSFALPDTSAGQAKVFSMIRDVLVPGGAVVIKDFDAAMREHAEFSRFDCPSIGELQEAFEGFAVVRAEVVETPAHGHGGEEPALAGAWTAALLHASKPS